MKTQISTLQTVLNVALFFTLLCGVSIVPTLYAVICTTISNVYHLFDNVTFRVSANDKPILLTALAFFTFLLIFVSICELCSRKK